MWIAIRCSDRIFRRFDDAMAHRLRTAVRIQKTMARRTVDVCFRWRGRFDNLHPGDRFDGREVGRRQPHILIGYFFGDRTHALVVAPGSTLKIIHLAHNVLGGQAGDVGGFRMALSRHKVAGATDHPCQCVVALHNPGCWRMFIGEPVGRIRVTGNPGGVVFLAAARYADCAGHWRGRRLHLIRDVVSPGGQTIGDGLRHRCLRGCQQSDQQRDRECQRQNADPFGYRVVYSAHKYRSEKLLANRDKHTPGRRAPA